MELPFSLHFIKKVEAFQTLKKLDKKFCLQINNFDGTIPTWEVEKKILIWTYQGHKHLGSPINTTELESRKNFALAGTLSYASGTKEAVEATPTNDFEVGYSAIVNHAYTESLIERVGKRKEMMHITPEESDAAGIEETLSNLVSKGYAKYYPELRRQVDGYSNESEINFIPSDTDNFEGVLISKEGLLMGELLNDIFYISEIDQGVNHLATKYKKFTGAGEFLFKKFFNSTFYQFLIIVSYIAFGLVIFIILKEAWQQVGHYVFNWLLPLFKYC